MTRVQDVVPFSMRIPDTRSPIHVRVTGKCSMPSHTGLVFAHSMTLKTTLGMRAYSRGPVNLMGFS